MPYNVRGWPKCDQPVAGLGQVDQAIGSHLRKHDARILDERQIDSLYLMTIVERLALQPFDDEASAPINEGHDRGTESNFHGGFYRLVEARLEDPADVLHVGFSQQTMSRQVHSPRSATRRVRIKRRILPIWREQMHRVENGPSFYTGSIKCPHHGIALDLAAGSQHYRLDPEDAAAPPVIAQRHH